MRNKNPSKRVKFDPTPPDPRELRKHATLAGVEDFARFLRDGSAPTFYADGPSAALETDKSSTSVPPSAALRQGDNSPSLEPVVKLGTVGHDDPPTSDEHYQQYSQPDLYTELGIGPEANLVPDPNLRSVANIEPVPNITVEEMESSVSSAALRKPGIGSGDDLELRTIDQRQASTGVDLIPVPDLGAHAPPIPRDYKPIRATDVQDGHTRSEHLLYLTLWGLAQSKQESSDSRVVTVGYATLRRSTKMARSTLQKLMHSLQEKLAVDVLNESVAATREAKTYRIWSMRTILRRRQAAGMTWFIRLPGGGVIPMAREIATTTANSGTGLKLQPGQENGVVGPNSGIGSGPNSGTDPIPSFGPNNIRKEEENPKGMTTTFLQATSTQIDRAIRHYVQQADSQALAKLVSECRHRAPNVTDEEIIEFIHAKGPFASKANNPMGFLLSVVPKCFEGDAFLRWRGERIRQAELRVRAQQEEMREKQRVDSAWRSAKARLDFLTEEQFQIEYENTLNQLFRDHPSLRRWNPQELQSKVRNRMLQKLFQQELARS